MADVMGTVVQGATSVLDWILIIVVIALLAVIGWYIWNILSYKHKFRIRELVNGRKVIIDDKAVEFVDRDDKTTYWKLLKSKQKITLPPLDAIDITDKGKKVVEAYRTSTGEYIYLHDTGTPDNSFKPLTTSERLMYINQIKKAQGRKTKSWKNDIPMMVTVGAAVILVICLMVFWGDMAKPVLASKAIGQQMMETQKETAEIMREIKQDIQVLKSEQNTNQQQAPD